MGFDQNGNWFYDPSDMDDAADFHEHAQKRAKEAVFDQGLRINQQTQNTQYIINDEIQLACEQHGLTPQQFNALDLGPQEQEAALRRATRKFVSKSVQRSKKAKGTVKAGQQPATGRQPAKPAPEIMQNAKAKVEAGGELTQNELLDALGCVLG